MRVTLTSAALRDLAEAEEWYRRCSPSALRSFIRTLDAALRFIAEYPEAAPLFEGETRGKTLTRFPYSVLYEVKPDRIVVMAIADERRDPGSYADHF